ncbi:MAG TPA: response regulator [Candidatus Acidoferrum sp.]|nr:response regulator [Candidatus Acidoferrum sp.]
MTDTTLLVLDDDAVFVEVLTRALQRRGYRALGATDSAAAIAQARATPPQYAIVDLKIAQENGLDCIGPLLAVNPAMHILMLTGYASVATAVTAIKAGAFDYACKPLDADEILAKLGLGSEQSSVPAAVETPSTLSVKRLAWEHIQRMLQEHDGNISATARALGMHRRTLQRMLQKRPVKQ